MRLLVLSATATRVKVWSVNAPGLANLETWYLASQIKNFRNGIRGRHADDLYGLQMGLVSNTMTDDQAINDMAAYIATLGQEQEPVDLARKENIRGKKMEYVAHDETSFVRPAEVPEMELYHAKTWTGKYVFSHAKTIAIQYAGTAIAIGMVALVLSWLMRLQLAWPNTFSFIDPAYYLQAVTRARHDYGGVPPDCALSRWFW